MHDSWTPTSLEQVFPADRVLRDITVDISQSSKGLSDDSSVLSCFSEVISQVHFDRINVSYILATARLLVPLARYFRSSFKRLLNSESVSRRTEKNSQAIRIVSLTVFTLFGQGRGWIVGGFSRSRTQVARTQRTFQMFTKIGLTLVKEDRDVLIVKRKITYQHGSVQEDSRCIANTFVGQIKDSRVTFLSCFFN